MAKETVVLTRVYRGKKQTKFGEKDSVGIKTQSHGDKWLSTFKTEGTENWKDGDEVTIYTEENNGYINFTTKPKEGDTSDLEERLGKLEQVVADIIRNRSVLTEKSVEVSTSDQVDDPDNW